MCTLVASLTLPMLPAPSVFCSCQSPTILPRGLSFPFLLAPAAEPLAAPLVRTPRDTAAAAASSRTSRMVGSCGVADANALDGGVDEEGLYDVEAADEGSGYELDREDERSTGGSVEARWGDREGVRLRISPPPSA